MAPSIQFSAPLYSGAGGIIGGVSEQEPLHNRGKMSKSEDHYGLRTNYVGRDILEVVLSYLPQEDLWEVGKVCKDWQEASQDDRLWKSLHFKKKGISSREVLCVCEEHPRVEELDLQEIKGIGDSFLYDLRSVLLSIKKLVLSGPNSGASNISCYEFLANLESRCPALKSFTLCVDLRWNSSLRIAHPHLKELELHRPVLSEITLVEIENKSREHGIGERTFLAL